MKKTRYVTAPVGWWQDSRGVSQPPGSYLDPSLRVGPAEHSRAGGHIKTARRWRRSATQTRTGEIA
jgi:hypothetical protein